MRPEDHTGGPVGCDQLGPFVDGELGATEAAAFRRHLVDCARCQQEMHGLMQLSALAEAARLQRTAPSFGRAPVPVSAADRRARPRRAAWMGVVGVAALAAALVLALRGGRSGPNVPALLASLDARTVSGWPSAAGPAQYRPYAVSRGTEQSTPPSLARAALRAEEANDLRSIATLALLRRDFVRADAVLGQLPARPDVLADRGLVRMEQGRCEEALEYLDRALGTQPDYLPALFNRGLCLRQLGLPVAAAAALGKVTDAQAGGWSTEAGTDRLAVEQRATGQAAREQAFKDAGAALVSSQRPPSPELLQQAPGRVRGSLNAALASAGTRAELERLLPVARELDSIAGGGVLEARVRAAVRSVQPARVALAERFRDWYLGIKAIPKEQLDGFVRQAMAAGQHDQALEAFASFAWRDASALRAQLVAEAGDPYHDLFLAGARAAEQTERGETLAAERSIRQVRPRCLQPSLDLACWYLDQESIEAETLLGRFGEAAAQAEASVERMRRLGLLGAERNALLQLGGVKLAADRLAAARATYEEVGLREPAQCHVTVFRLENLAMGYVRRLDGRSADALLASEPPCDVAMDWWRLELRLDLAQLADDPGRMREVSAGLQRASADASLGERERLMNALFLERSRLELGEPPASIPRTVPGGHEDDLEVRRALARTRIARFFAAIRASDAAGAVAELAPVAGSPSPGRCAIAVGRDLTRTGWSAVGPAGERASAWSRRDGRPDSALVPPEARRMLANCPQVAVLTTADLHGAPDLLPESLAWSYRVAAERTPSPSGAARLLVRDPRPPPELELPPLRIEGLPAGQGWTVLEGKEATPAKVLEAMTRAGFIEFAVHGRIDAQIPDGAMLVLSEDQDRNYALSASALRTTRLQGRPLVILGACHAGAGSNMRDEPWSLPRAMVDAGARAVIASKAELPDAEASQFFEGVRRRVETGSTPSVALRDERLAWIEKGRPWVIEVVAFD
ncbi:MAG TPA: CHAT domain-containing protein [Myxococcaceae bacterium]|nr:CHAT domain-containing protein [Myxococcaceae bacterium]